MSWAELLQAQESVLHVFAQRGYPIALKPRLVVRIKPASQATVFPLKHGGAGAPPQTAVTAFDAAFRRIANDMIAWTVRALP